jgi:hypothetical protein
MRDYTSKMLEEFPPEMQAKAETPAQTYLFDINKCAKPNEEKARFFHYFTAKLLILWREAYKIFKHLQPSSELE